MSDEVEPVLPPRTGTILDYAAGGYGDVGTSREGRAADHPHGALFQSPWHQEADGFSEHGRRLARALSDTGLPIHLQSPSKKFFMYDPHAERDLGEEFRDLAEASIGRYCGLINHTVPSGGMLTRIVNAAHVRRVMPPEVLDTYNSCRVLSTVWERHTGIPADDVAALNAVGQCWVTCSHTAKVLTDGGVDADKLRQVPVPYFPDDPHLGLRNRRRRSGVPRFYAIGKWEPRKEHRNLLLAFLRAFSPGDAALFLKTSPSGPPNLKGYPLTPGDAAREALEDSHVRQNGWTHEAFNRDVFIIAKYVSSQQLLKLHEMGDVYCTLSRGEGFDMPAFDARLAGNTLVYTPSGGPQSFAAADDFLVPETGQIACNDFYKWQGATYLDYDVDAAVKQLQAAAEVVVPAVRRSMTRRDDLALLDRFRAEVVGADMRAYLSELPGWPL